MPSAAAPAPTIPMRSGRSRSRSVSDGIHLFAVSVRVRRRTRRARFELEKAIGCGESAFGGAAGVEEHAAAEREPLFVLPLRARDGVPNRAPEGSLVCYHACCRAELLHF